MERAQFIWHNGKLIAWEDAKVHVLTHGLHYGTGVFDGLRSYETPHGIAIFRHHDHLNRLFKSAGLYYMSIPYTLVGSLSPETIHIPEPATLLAWSLVAGGGAWRLRKRNRVAG